MTVIKCFSMNSMVSAKGTLINKLQISNKQRIESLEFTSSCCIILAKEKESLMQLVKYSSNTGCNKAARNLASSC